MLGVGLRACSDSFLRPLLFESMLKTLSFQIVQSVVTRGGRECVLEKRTREKIPSLQRNGHFRKLTRRLLILLF